MSEHDWLAQEFEEHRPHLRTVAYRMLGSATESDDAVQEAWLRLSRVDRATSRTSAAGRDGRRPGLPGHAAVASRPA